MTGIPGAMDAKIPVTIVNEERQSKPRHMKTAIIACTATAVVLLVILLPVYFFALKEGVSIDDAGPKQVFYITEKNGDTGTVTETVDVDPSNLIIIADVPATVTRDASINMFDFNKGFLAIKVVDKCFIMPFNDSFTESVKLISQLQAREEPVAMEHGSRSIAVTPAIHPQVAEYTLGPRLTTHCRQHPMYWLVDKQEGGSGENNRMRRASNDPPKTTIKKTEVYIFGIYCKIVTEEVSRPAGVIGKENEGELFSLGEGK